MRFLAIVNDNHLREQLQHHAQAYDIQFMGGVPPHAPNKYAALLVDLSLVDDLPTLLQRASEPVLALAHNPQDGYDAVCLGADDYLLINQIDLMLNKRLDHYAGVSSSASIVERVGDGVLIVDDEGIIRYCNPAAADFLGHSSQEIIGQNFGYPIVGGETAEIDLFQPGSTEPRVIELRAVETQWQGQPGHLATLRDVTDRIEAAQNLYLRDRAMHASTSAIFIMDVTTKGWRLTYANPAFEDVTGYHVMDVLREGYGFLRDMHEEMPEADELLHILDNQQAFNVTTQSLHRNSRRYWSELRISPIYDDLGRLSHIVGVQNDITQSKILEQERLQKEKIEVALRKERELNHIKDRFLTLMAHELHTPLASIMLSYDMLNQYGNRASEEDRKEFLDNIRQQVERLNRMVNDVLEISRAHASDIDLHPETLDLVPFCRQVVRTVQRRHKNTHKLRFESQPNTIRTTVDPNLMERALTNLLSNAVKYSPKGGQITLSLDASDDTVHIIVQDEGIGVPSEDQPRLFDPFHRGENVGNLPGTGLGLTIVRQVIRAHEGQVSVQSREGEGTTFTIELPIAVAL